jgi:hypothetical protein
VLIDDGCAGPFVREVGLVWVVVAAVTGAVTTAERDAFLAGDGGVERMRLSEVVPLSALAAVVSHLTVGTDRPTASTRAGRALALLDPTI